MIRTIIDSEQLYPFSAAAKLIPSSRGGAVNVGTLHRWLRAGLFAAHRRRLPGGKSAWFIRGADLITLRDGERVEAGEAISPRVELPAKRQRKSDPASIAHLKRLGIIK